MFKNTKPQLGIYCGNAITIGNSLFNFYKHTSNWFDSQSGFARVSKKNPCKICGKKDWCSYTKNEVFALCMRESSGSVKTATNGAFIHVLNPQPYKVRVSAPSAPSLKKNGTSGKAEIKNIRADINQLDEIYTYLLDECLNLRSFHADHLRIERLLSDTTIAANLYASVPTIADLPSVIEKIRNKFGDKLKGVAGFYKDNKNIWQFNRPRDGGFFIPYRDEKGRIQGLQIRRDDYEKSNKYIWFSTNPDDFKDGTSSGSPMHFTLPHLVKHMGEIIITEGALKADCFSELTGKPCIALAGVNVTNPKILATKIKEVFPELQEVTIAFDADWKTNKAVKTALFKLLRHLSRSGFKVKIWGWDINNGKGIDDLFANEKKEENNDK